MLKWYSKNKIYIIYNDYYSDVISTTSNNIEKNIFNNIYRKIKLGYNCNIYNKYFIDENKNSYKIKPKLLLVGFYPCLDRKTQKQKEDYFIYLLKKTDFLKILITKNIIFTQINAEIHKKPKIYVKNW